MAVHPFKLYFPPKSHFDTGNLINYHFIHTCVRYPYQRKVLYRIGKTYHVCFLSGAVCTRNYFINKHLKDLVFDLDPQNLNFVKLDSIFFIAELILYKISFIACSYIIKI